MYNSIPTWWGSKCFTSGLLGCHCIVLLVTNFLWNKTTYKSTQQYSPEDHNPHCHHCESLKSQKWQCLFMTVMSVIEHFLVKNWTILCYRNTHCVLVRFHVLMAVSMKMTVFCDVAPCSLVEVYWSFRGSCCLHHQGDHPDDGGSNIPEDLSPSYGGSKHLWNTGKLLLGYTVQYPRRQSSSHTMLCGRSYFTNYSKSCSISYSCFEEFYRKRPELVFQY
jgi:hypothetical protein